MNLWRSTLVAACGCGTMAVSAIFPADLELHESRRTNSLLSGVNHNRVRNFLLKPGACNLLDQKAPGLWMTMDAWTGRRRRPSPPILPSMSATPTQCPLVTTGGLEEDDVHRLPMYASDNRSAFCHRK